MMVVGTVLVSLGALFLVCESAPTVPGEIVHEWVSVDYDWPNDTAKSAYITSGNLVLENNIISGIKVYKGDIYVTVPRWRAGVPSSLNTVITKNGKAVLKPFPDWESQTIGDCKALQYVQSVEIDHARGWMCIIDTGRLDILPGSTPRNFCPPKVLIYDINKRTYLRRYEFPATVVSPTTNFLNDIVVEIVNGQPSYAYLTDTDSGNPGLVVYDVLNNTSHRFHHKSMVMEPGGGDITINNVKHHFSGNINGIALSPDSNYLYYSPLAGYTLYQVPTRVLRSPTGDFAAAVRDVGKKVSQTGGMVYGQTNLYYGALNRNAVYKWQAADDAKSQNGYPHIAMKTQAPVFTDNRRLEWVDTFAFDGHGYLWFTSNSLITFFEKKMDFSENKKTSNMKIWRVKVGENGYLDHGGSVDPPIIG